MSQDKGKPDVKKAKYIVAINHRWCKNCGICVAFCPRGVFESDEFGKPLIKRREECIKCMLCVIRCPDFAVTVVDDKKEK